MKLRSRKSTSYTSVARARCRGGRSGGFAVTCSSRGRCRISFTSRCAPSPWAPPALPRARVSPVRVSVTQSHGCHRPAHRNVTESRGHGHDLPWGVRTRRARWAGETHNQSSPGNTRGFPLRPLGVLLEDFSVIHPPVMFLNDLFTSPKNPEHQRVLSHRPNNHQVPRSHNPLQHNQLTWLNSPALDTHQPMIILCFTTDISHPKT